MLRRLNYANPDNHNCEALLAYADPIARQLWPAIATYGFLSLFPGLGLRNVFERGIMEFMASMTLPFSLAFAIIFCGINQVVANRNSFLCGCSQRISGYWASFCISLCAATLGVVAGLFFPYICANGIWAALEFLCIGLLAASAYGVLAHQVGVLAFSNWNGRWVAYRSCCGLALFICGVVLVTVTVCKHWVEVNAI